jgi:hypothetical protein
MTTAITTVKSRIIIVIVRMHVYDMKLQRQEYVDSEED